MTHKNTKTTSLLRRTGLIGGAAAIAVTAGTAMAAAPANAATSSASVWDRVAQCESGGNWSTNTGNGFSGGLQFTASTWKAYGGTGSAQNASKAEQIRVAKKVLQGQGPGAWPVCSQKAGLTRANGGAASAGSSSTSTAGSSSTSTTSYSQSSTAKKSYTATTPKKAYSSYTAQKSVAPKAATVQSTPRHAATTVTNVKGSGKYVTVKSGDTLSKLADANGVDSWQSLYSLNKTQVQNPDLIFVGEKLELPA